MIKHSMAMLTSYGPLDSALTAIGSGAGAYAGMRIAEQAGLDNITKAGLIGGIGTLGAYAMLKLRPEPAKDAKPQIPQEGEELVGFTASAATAASTLTALTLLSPLGPTVQYLGSAAAASMTYTITYEVAKAVNQTGRAVYASVSNGFRDAFYTLLPFLKPKEEKKDQKPEKKEEDEEDDEKDSRKKAQKKMKNFKPKSKNFDDYIWRQISVEKAK